MSKRILSGTLLKLGDSGSASVNSSGRVRCHHKAPCIVQTSDTDMNPGRQFYGCPYWKDPKENCRFFRWVEGNDDELETQITELGNTILKLEESLRRAECKGERRKKEKQLVAEELRNVMAIHDAMFAETRRIKTDVGLNRYMLTILLILNAMVLVVMCRLDY